MTVASDNRPWIRLLDGDMFVVPEQPVERLYPKDLDEVLQSVKLAINPPLGAPPQARAIGSHWALSNTGVTTGFMIETSTPVHEPGGDQAHRLNKVLYDVIPECLTQQAYRFFLSQMVPTFNPAVPPTGSEIYLFHVQAGTRIYELYSALDKGDVGMGKDSIGDRVHHDTNMPTPNPHDYSGPWALESMGGAGGQTIVGAFSTGTHGGDLGFGPIADAVRGARLRRRVLGIVAARVTSSAEGGSPGSTACTSRYSDFLGRSRQVWSWCSLSNMPRATAPLQSCQPAIEAISCSPPFHRRPRA